MNLNQLLQTGNSPEIIQHGLNNLRNYKIINEIVVHCTNHKINVLDLIRKYLQIDPLNTPMRANYALQLLLWGGRQDTQEACKVIRDLMGLEHQNVKTLMKMVLHHFKKFSILPLEEQCDLFLEISHHYSSDIQALKFLLDSGSYHPSLRRLLSIKDPLVNYYLRYKLVFLTGQLDPDFQEINQLYQLTKFYQSYPSLRLSQHGLFVASELFNSLQSSPMHNHCFNSFSKKQTLKHIQTKCMPAVSDAAIGHANAELQLLLALRASDKDINFQNSLSTVLFNLQLLKSFEDSSCTCDGLKHVALKDDPQLTLQYLFTLLATLLEHSHLTQAQKVVDQLNALNLPSNSEVKNLAADINFIIGLNLSDKPFNLGLLKVLKKIDISLYLKYAIHCQDDVNLQEFPKKVKVKTIVQLILMKQSNEMLKNYFDQLFELLCQKSTKNPPRSLLSFLELVHLFSHFFDHAFISSKLQDYFAIKSDSIYNNLYSVLQQLEHSQSNLPLNREYISIVAKLLFLISMIAQKIINQREESFHYFTQSVKYIQQLVHKIPQLESVKQFMSYRPLSINKVLKMKSTLIDLSLIERYMKLHQLDHKPIAYVKLSLLQSQEVPEALILDASQSQTEFQILSKFYPNTYQPKEYKFISKVLWHKLTGRDLKLKQLPAKPTLSQFLKQAHKLMSLKRMNSVTKLQVHEQLLQELTSSVFSFSTSPKYTEQLFRETDISVIKIEHRELAAFYSEKNVIFSYQLAYNQRADALTTFTRLCTKVVNSLSKMGFYKAITKVLENIEIFLYRCLAITDLLKVNSKIAWSLDQQQSQSFIDLVSNSIKIINKNERISVGEQQSEYTRQSLYRQRKSYVKKIKDTHNKILQVFSSDNILRHNKFYQNFNRFILEFLCIHNHSQNYLYDKLKIQRYGNFKVQTNCTVLKQLLECSNPMDYKHQVDENSIHEIILSKQLIYHIIPMFVLGGCTQENPNQNYINYMQQLQILVQTTLSTSLLNSIEQTKLYFYLLLRMQEFMKPYQPVYGQKKCFCTRYQPNYDKEKLLFDLTCYMASYQMSMKRVLRQQEDFSIYKCNDVERTFSLPSIIDIRLKRDIVAINLFEYNGDKIILVSKYQFRTDRCTNKQVNSINKCFQFKDALIYYLKIIQENIDCMQDKSSSKQQWWAKRDYYEQQLVKRQTNIENSLGECLDFICMSEQPLLILSQQLQLLPWDHFKNTVFNRVLSLGHIVDLCNLQVDPKQDLFYVLNPGNDLNKTEVTLLPILQQHKLKGLIGQKPSTQLIIDCLQRKDYYMYIGHGGGEQYFSEKQILSTHQYFNGRPYLLGCSSAQMMELSRFKLNNVSQQEIFLNYVDWHGLAVSYLLRGCPTVFGALWPITDKDADKYAIDLIHQYGEKKLMSPNEIVLKTRPKCALKQFNGTAFVIYGFTQ